MPTTGITLIRGDKVDLNTDYRDALSVNMYPVAKEILGASGYMLCYPGLTLHGTGSGVDRGAMYNDRQAQQFRVSGTKLVSVGDNGTTIELGEITGSSQAAMAYSFNTQAIVADGNYYLYDSTNGYRQIADSDLGSPIDMIWVDSYYFFTDGEYLYHTDIDDEESIDPLNYATSEYSPDPTLGLSLTQDDKVMAWNRYSLEYFDNDASADFAFSRLSDRAQKIGIVATHAKCEAGGNWYITGGRREESLGVHVVNLGSAQKISTREIDKLLAEYSEPDLSDMRMESRMQDDTTFIIVHLPNETLCFNQSIASSMGLGSAWSILKTGTGDEVYRGINGVFDSRLGKWIYGDKTDGSIGILDNEVFTQYGNLQEWYLYSPLLDLETMSIDELTIETIPGNVVDDDATVAFSTTTNGITYSNEYWNLYGESLDRNQRFFLRGLGIVNDWVGFRFRGATKSRMSFALMKVTYG